MLGSRLVVFELAYLQEGEPAVEKGFAAGGVQPVGDQAAVAGTASDATVVRQICVTFFFFCVC